MVLSLDISYAVTLLLAIPAAGFLVRIFIIQHDCGHGAFFRLRRINDAVGTMCGVMTLTPMPTGGASMPVITPTGTISTGGTVDTTSIHLS
ncbi:fatty acid desaturase [Azospirillum sp. TSA2s]|jgi:fatty acid desaturase|uniref:fatty acid desaturase n=1 Tax=Azospirillum sp. TSA2s TaxID=709810 RepID=UPI001FFE3F72|nr:fatty acid desaturase [Azospirillum sp. TSA2s]